MKKLKKLAVAILSLSLLSAFWHNQEKVKTIPIEPKIEQVEPKENTQDKSIEELKRNGDQIAQSAKDLFIKGSDKVADYLENKSENINTVNADSELVNLEYEGQIDVPVNNNQSTLNWDWETNKIVYSPLDNLNRAGKAVAYLSKVNYGKSEGREGQQWQPTGWNNQKRNQDRGHLIAYTLSFNFDNDGNFQQGELGSIDNPKNLFTQTSQSNRGAMQNYEEIVREAIKQDKKVIYEVTPIFKNDELMARGVHLQAISEDKSVNFNTYIFNIDDDYNFDYATGRSTKK